jgi:uncharacterized protein YaaN involved in tellurite resistance
MTTTKTTLDLNLVEDQTKGMLVPVGEVFDAADSIETTKLAPVSVISDAEINAAMAEIDLDQTNTITRFGYKASEAATAVAAEMLQGVRNKDTGPVGEVMNDMMLNLRKLNVDKLNGGGIFGWMKKQSSRVVQFGQKFETVQNQIESMRSNLITHQTTLMTSVATMDRLYEKTEQQFHTLEVYIMGGERMLDHLNEVAMPALKAEVESGKDGADGTPASLMPQKFTDLQSKRDQLERKVHDLHTVRVVTLYSLPKIRLIQDTDNNLIGKIDSIATTTIPMWYKEMAMAIEQAKTQSAADSVNLVSDVTNDMLMRSGDQFQKATIDARKAVERSVVGVDAVKYHSEKILETFEEAIKITEAGKIARKEAGEVLLGTEKALRAALSKES